MYNRLTKVLALLLIGILVCSFGFTKSNVPVDTMVIAANTGIFITMDPGMVYEVLPGKIVDAFYAKLIELEAQGETLVPVPRLAEKWEISQDGMTYTITMRKGLKFANGDPLDATDAVWSLNRSLRMNSSSKWLIESVGINQANMNEKIKLIDNLNLSLTFDKPYASNIILGILTNQFAAVVNRKQIEPNIVGEDMGQNWLNDNSAGAGSYILQKWERNSQIVLVANPNYVRGTPKMRRIILIDVPEAANQRLMVEKGDADVAWNVTGQMLKEMTANKEVRIVKVPGHGNEYLAMNTSWGALKEPKVRLAIRYAINYDDIVNILMDGNALKVQGFVSKGYFGFVANNPFYPDVEKAKALLAEAGYPNGFEVELLTSNAGPRPAEAEKIQSDLAKIGIKANIVIVQGSQLYTKYRVQGHQMIIGGWGNDYPDADNLAQAHANYKAKQLAWRNAWYDEFASNLTVEAQFEKDPVKRELMYKILTDYWFLNGPFAMLYQTVETWPVRVELKGFEEAAMGYGMLFDFTKLYK